MNRDSIAKLRLDRRLLERRGWLNAEDRKRALEALPDVSAKRTTLGAAADERGGPEAGSGDSGESPTGA